MAGGTINRINGGDFTTFLDEGFTGYFEKTDLYAGKQNRFKAKQTNIAKPKSPPSVGKYFVRGWWTDENDKPIKEALIGQKVKFHIQMDKNKVPAGSKINCTLLDWDGVLNPDDPLKLYSTTKDTKTNTYPEINEMIADAAGKASLSINLTEGLLQFTEDDGGNEIELYFECSYYDKSDRETEQLDLPAEEFNYLTVYEKEVLITVLIELPHSKETGWGAKGLAGHSAMAIGERYFDYGPNNTPGIYNEKDYDSDFNNDGDKDDDVQLNEPSFMNSPGQPWWGTHIAQRKGIKPEQVNLRMVLEHIKLHWKGRYDPISQSYPDATQIYGKVHKIEFYVKEREANKMIQWWEEHYKHLKVYSVKPWTGEQCTTTVKSAIQEAFPFKVGGNNWIPDATQTPEGLLEDLKAFVSTSKQHFGQLATITVIKNEALDWTN